MTGEHTMRYTTSKQLMRYVTPQSGSCAYLMQAVWLHLGTQVVQKPAVLRGHHHYALRVKLLLHQQRFLTDAKKF